MNISFSVEDLAAIVAPQEIRGQTSDIITGIASLQEAGEGDLSFLSNPKYRPEVARSAAAVVLVPPDCQIPPAAGHCHLVVENPSGALALICARLEQLLWPPAEAGVHASAVVSSQAQIDAQATVGPLCVIEAGAQVGAGSHLQAQVFVGRDARIGQDCWLAPGSHVATQCVLADRVRLHAGVVVGSDGFGYEVVDGRHAKVPQVGHVVIEDDVEVGANSTFDRARFSQTVVGQGTKVDNLVQVAHNVIIGQHCLLCAQVGIAGSTTLADYVVMGGQAGAAGHLSIAQGIQVGGRGGVTTSLTETEGVYSGNPAMPYQLERRLVVLQRRLPDLFKKVDGLVSDLEALKKTFA